MLKKLALTAAICLALTSCDSSEESSATDEPSASETSTSTTDAPTEDEAAAADAVESYLSAFYDEKLGEACAALTAERRAAYVKEMSVLNDKPLQGCEEALALDLEIAEALDKGDDVQVVSTVVDGDTATVVVEEGDEALDRRFSLTRRGSAWLIADEADADAAGGDTERWLASWCDVEPGMSVDEAADLMGAPTAEAAGALPQVTWQGRVTFTAFLDDVGTITQLQVDEQSLTDADRSVLTCDANRDAY